MLIVANLSVTFDKTECSVFVTDYVTISALVRVRRLRHRGAACESGHSTSRWVWHHYGASARL